MSDFHSQCPGCGSRVLQHWPKGTHSFYIVRYTQFICGSSVIGNKAFEGGTFACKEIERLKSALRQIRHSMDMALVPGNDVAREVQLVRNVTEQSMSETGAESSPAVDPELPCVACEGLPSGDNVPCAVCGRGVI